MPLTALAIRALQPREREFTASDGGSLFLVMTPSGGKLWRFDSRFGRKQKKLVIGGLPVIEATVGLVEDIGGKSVVHLAWGGGSLRVKAPGEVGASLGAGVGVAVNVTGANLFDAAGIGVG